MSPRLRITSAHLQHHAPSSPAALLPCVQAGGTPLEGAFGAKPKPAASRTLADAIAAGEAGKGPANGANDQSAVCTIA